MNKNKVTAVTSLILAAISFLTYLPLMRAMLYLGKNNNFLGFKSILPIFKKCTLFVNCVSSELLLNINIFVFLIALISVLTGFFSVRTKEKKINFIALIGIILGATTTMMIFYIFRNTGAFGLLIY